MIYDHKANTTILQGILHTESETKQNHERAENTIQQGKKRQEGKE
jgi:hypothetical protein